jgi:hypothetical protein
MTDARRSSAASRLVARAARPGVRPGDAASEVGPVEIVELPTAPLPATAVAAAPRPREPERVPPAAPSPAPRAATTPSEPLSPRLARHAPPTPPAKPSARAPHRAPVVEAPTPRPDPLVAGERADPAGAPLEARDADADPPPVAAPREPSRPVEPVGWQALAETPAAGAPPEHRPAAAVSGGSPQDARPRETASPMPAPSPHPVPAPRAPALQSPVSPPRATAPRVAAGPPSAAAPPVVSQPPSPPPPVAPTAPPPVLIERIEVITPPADAPRPDPFASLAGRRNAASRHLGAGR